jgi:hypothetical protein
MSGLALDPGTASPCGEGRCPPIGGGQIRLEDDMTDPNACPDCLRRSWLLGLAAPYIERVLLNVKGPDRLALLGLGNEDLAAAVAPKHSQLLVAQMLAHVEALSADHFADN